MTKLIAKKRLGGPYPPVETTTRREAMPAYREEEAAMDFGFDSDDYDDEEGYGALYEPEYTNSINEPPAAASPPMKKPLKKPMLRSAVADGAVAADPSSEPHKCCAKAANSEERGYLTCKLSKSHHRRLKIYSIMEGASILSILEDWIDLHCPPV